MSEPVNTDPQADVLELLRRCAEDYGDAQTHRVELDHEDRVHGNEPGHTTS